LVRPPRDKSLPVILSLKEVNKIFSCIKMEHHKACLKTIYKDMYLKMIKALTFKNDCFFSGKNRAISLHLST